MKKAFDQTIRDIKREVNKKVLKVPSIEQKVLDATSNEPWGPHGSLLADIAQATKNYHEYQMIMSVIWKRINDTGKNWRHVYKALTVLEYLVAHGSERVIDEIREHAYQISTLSDFQYIDSSGRDQGNNVRRKSQSLVLLVNDKERIQEVRQKAASNRDKFRNTTATGGMYRPGSGGYGDDRYEGRYGGKEDERNGYRDDERYGRYGDSYSREGDRDGRDSDEHYSRYSYRDDDSRGRSRSVDEYQYGSRSRSSDRDGDRPYDDYDHHSSRESSVRAEDQTQDGRPLERKFSEQNLGAPPSYEEAVGDSRSPTYSERDGELPAAPAPLSSSRAANAAPQSSSPIVSSAPQLSSPIANAASQLSPTGSINPNMEADTFDEFDPRGSAPAAPSTSNNAEMDLLGSLSDVFSPSPLAIMPPSSGTADVEVDAMKTASAAPFTAASSENIVLNQSFEDPFGDSPFKAIPSDEPQAQPQNFASMPSFQPADTFEHSQAAVQKVDTGSNLEFTDAFPGLNFNSTNGFNTETVPNPQYLSQETQSLQDDDILAGILPPSGPSPTSQASFPVSSGMPSATAGQTAFSAATGLPTGMGSQTAFPASTSQPHAASFMHQSGHMATHFSNMAVPPPQHNHQSSLSYSGQSTAFNPNSAPQPQTGTLSHQNSGSLSDFLPQAGPTISSSSQSAPSSSPGPLALVPHQPAKEKFEPKSAVWADTLSRGLVNLNISGPKTNPLSDIGVDFESLNRKEKRMEKPSAAPVTSNVTMGKAMGSGTGMGRASVGAMRPPPNPMMGSNMGMGMGMGGGPGVGMGMGGYGSMNQQPMGMGMGSMGIGMNMGVNMGMGQGVQMQPTNGLAPGSNMGNYNPMMGRGGYPQQPYGGYR